MYIFETTIQTAWIIATFINIKSDYNFLAYDFEDPNSLNDDQFYNLTGLTKSNFDHLINICEENLQYERKRSIRNCVGLCLTKLRVGLSLNEMEAFFNLDRSTISKSIDKACSILTDNFVPRYLGFMRKWFSALWMMYLKTIQYIFRSWPHQPSANQNQSL